MKLYVWTEPYGVSYGSSMVFAIASDLRSARRIAARTASSYSFGQCENKEVKRLAKIKLGKPTRVVSLPCAEWHEWSE